jgi:hypothetical protein
VIGTEKSKPRTNQQQQSDDFDKRPTMSEEDYGLPQYPLEKEIESEQHG